MNKGFTFIEIILVILILSVIVAITVPNFSRTYGTFQLKKTANDLAYIMQYAQSRAVTRNQLMRLEFNADFSKYWLTEKKDNVDQFDRFRGRLGKIFDISQKTKVIADKKVVNFYPDGTIEKQYLYVCDDKQKCLTVSTKEQRGYVQVLDFKKE